MKIIFFIVDSLRYDYVGVYNPEVEITPQIDRIAEEGVVFENAFSQSNWTYPSLYSLLTSLYPSRLNLTFFNQKIIAPDRILPEILAKHGYHTAVFSSFKTLVNPKTFGGHFKERRLLRASNETIIEFRKWLRANKNKKNLFLFFHLGDFTHVPYCVPKSFLKKENQEKILHNPVIQALTTEHSSEIKIKEIFKKINARLLHLKPEELQFLKDCYKDGIKFIDSFIGKCFDILSEETADFFFTLCADHGECFLEHGIIGHGVSLYNELIKIPMIVFGSGIKAGRAASPVQLLDFYPTICDLAEIDYKELEIDGISLFKRVNVKPKHVLSEAYPLISVIDGNYKLISSHLKYKTKKKLFWEFKEILVAKKMGRLAYHLQALLKKDEFYHIKKDKGERENLQKKEWKKYLEMKKALKEYITNSQELKLECQNLDIEDDLKSQLEGLGYL